MADPIHTEVAVTWAAAAGCLFYLGSMYRRKESGGSSPLFVMAVLAAVLGIRGFGWLLSDARFARPTFMFASLLPLAITLFIERVLRRHHPLWVKLLALTVSSTFFCATLFTDLTRQRMLLGTFGVCFAVTVFVNAALLLARRRAELSLNETRLSNLLLLVALISVPLVISDFRTLLGTSPIRLGGLAALLFVYALVGSTVRSLDSWQWLARFGTLALLAFLLSALFALALEGVEFEAWRARCTELMPVAMAWLLLSGIVADRVAISTGGNNQAFIRWLSRARLDSVGDFLRSLGNSPDASTYLVLEPRDLADYRVETLQQLARHNGGVVSLVRARQLRHGGDSGIADSAEQWIDLLERLQMSHGFLAHGDSPNVVVISLPTSTSAAAAEARLRVVQHLAQHLRARC